uniref:Predicted protein n=1 Tax=Hordeum vulgare subsp. vulgare TaxID=112509 RepID=F2E762_HORVV|nr:predicted protein [Hordeum vulgare subsp. vulgare]
MTEDRLYPSMQVDYRSTSFSPHDAYNPMNQYNQPNLYPHLINNMVYSQMASYQPNFQYSHMYPNQQVSSNNRIQNHVQSVPVPMPMNSHNAYANYPVLSNQINRTQQPVYTGMYPQLNSTNVGPQSPQKIHQMQINPQYSPSYNPPQEIPPISRAKAEEKDSSFSFFQFTDFQINGVNSGSSSPSSSDFSRDAPTSRMYRNHTQFGDPQHNPPSFNSNATAFPNLYLNLSNPSSIPTTHASNSSSSPSSSSPTSSNFMPSSPNKLSLSSYLSSESNDVDDNNYEEDNNSYEDGEFEETEPEEVEQVYSISYNSENRQRPDRAAVRILNRIEKSLSRLNHSMSRKNRVGANMAHNQLEKDLAQWTAYSNTHSSSSADTSIVDHARKANEHFANAFQREMKKVDDEREDMLAKYRQTILDLQQDVSQSKEILDEAVQESLEHHTHQAKQSINLLAKN